MRKKFLFFCLVMVICICSAMANAASKPQHLGMWGKNGSWQELPKNIQYSQEMGTNFIMINKEKDAQIPSFPKGEVELAYYFYDVPEVGSVKIYFLAPTVLQSTDNEEHYKLNFYGLVGGMPLMISPKENALFMLDTIPSLTSAAQEGLYMLSSPKGFFFFRLIN